MRKPETDNIILCWQHSQFLFSRTRQFTSSTLKYHYCSMLIFYRYKLYLQYPLLFNLLERAFEVNTVAGWPWILQLIPDHISVTINLSQSSISLLLLDMSHLFFPAPVYFMLCLCNNTHPLLFNLKLNFLWACIDT